MHIYHIKDYTIEYMHNNSIPLIQLMREVVTMWTRLHWTDFLPGDGEEPTANEEHRNEEYKNSTHKNYVY